MCIHTERCCRIHGCAHDEDSECIVWLGIAVQKRPCVLCGDETPKGAFKEFLIRNKEANHSQGFYYGRDDFWVESQLNELVEVINFKN